MLANYELYLKWAMLSVAYAVISVPAACAEDGSFSALLRGSDIPRSEPMIASTAPVQNIKLPQATDMLGKAANDIENLFGAPGLRREEPGAQVWQYANQDCVLLLYLYEDANRDWRVTHAETRKKNTYNGSGNCGART